MGELLLVHGGEAAGAGDGGRVGQRVRGRLDGGQGSLWSPS